MEDLICVCGNSIPDEDIVNTLGTNEEGEEYSEVYAYCGSCKEEYEANCWGHNENISEAKHTLIEKYELLKIK